MNSIRLSARPLLQGLHSTIRRSLLACVCLVLVACGGSADAPPPPESSPAQVQAVPPTITPQPVSISVTAGQPASFSVAATGTAPLAYQWQRNNADIAGANTTTYSLQATVLGDSGAIFRAVVTNIAGTATSNAATLTVTAAVPVLTITQQPASTSVVAGTQATFTVAATCSSGTLAVQWQRGSPANFADVVGATALTFNITPAQPDSGATFRAVLDCSGQSSTTSNTATLTVTAPASVVLSVLSVGLRTHADIPLMTAIVEEASGSFAFITNNRIKRLSADLSTITEFVGGPFSGAVDAVGAAASFNQPSGLVRDGAGNLYVADNINHLIRRVATDGTVTTVAGLAGTSGTTDGTGAAARFNQPAGIALGPDGDLYVSDYASFLIRRVTTAGVVTTYAGSASGFLDGAALSAKFSSPTGMAVAANGDVLVADLNNNRIRRIVRNGNVAGAVETLAGNGAFNLAPPDGIGTAATISNPAAVVVRGNTLTVREYGLLRQIDLTSAVVTTLTGSRALGEGYADGDSSTARIRGGGIGLATAPNGGFMLADGLAIRSVSAAGIVRTLASAKVPTINSGVDGIGTLPQVPFFDPIAVTIDPSGNAVVADSTTRIVRRVSPAGVVTLVAGLTGSFGGTTSSGSSNGGPVDGIGSEAQFSNLGRAVASDTTGVLYVVDGGGLRRISTAGAVTQPAGDVTQYGAVNGTGSAARFNLVLGLAAGAGGVVYVGDAGNNAVRRIDAAGNVTTYAGVMGQPGNIDGPIATARFTRPGSMALAPDGSLYVVDNYLRRIAADGSSVSTLTAQGGGVFKVAIDSAGTIYYSTATDLVMWPAGAATGTLLIPVGNSVVLGSNPQLAFVTGIAVLGPKQLVILSGGQVLRATLP